MRSLTIFLLLFPVKTFSQTIENVWFEQQGDQIVIYYDLIKNGHKGNFTINAYYTID
jgi:hypothetical protein